MFEWAADIHWLVFATILAIGAAGYNISLRFVGEGTNQFSFSAFFSFCAICLISMFIAYGWLSGAEMLFTLKGAMIAMIAGIGFFIVDLAIINMFRAGAPISLSVALLRIGTAFSMTVIGLLVFSEILSPIKALGIVFACVGIYLLSQRPKPVIS
jgi:drug/metabolite transporter (DMT)-like permease